MPEIPERDINKPKSADEWSNHISEFAHKWELGTPEHCAVNDFLNLQLLYGRFGEKPSSYISDIGGESSLSQEQRENRDLQKIALLEHNIEQNQARLPGYSNAYVHLSVSFQELLGSAAMEAKAKFTDDSEKEKEYVKKIYEETLDYVYGDVFERQDPNL
jgi:hypothetical protein